MTATFPSSPEPSDPPLPPYRLSALLQAHTSDVRYLSVAPLASSPQLFSASRDGSARSWVQKEGVEWMQDKEWKQGHEGFANALCWIPPVEEEEDKAGYLATSGSDALIQLYSLSSPSSAPVQTLLGHAHNVCALHASKDGTKMVSASWDGTARVWERRREEEAREEGEEGEWTCERVLADHGAAVWDVLMLEEGGGGDSVLTACADSRIRLFDGDKLRHLFKGHEGPVRSLCVLLPEEADSTLFASGSNDGTIRLWDWRTGTALSILGQQGSFVYSLAPIPSRAGGGLASSGEDGIIKIWNEEGREGSSVESRRSSSSFSTSCRYAGLEGDIAEPWVTDSRAILCRPQPTRAYFGQKDIQQALLLRRMLIDLHVPNPTYNNLVILPTYRDPASHLALSSRNAYLLPEERPWATVLV
ncbi:hypothetical protein NBRC10512_008223, partial [Rhodotorula toruloides]